MYIYTVCILTEVGIPKAASPTNVKAHVMKVELQLFH